MGTKCNFPQREAVERNLLDAGCECEKTQQFLRLLDEGRVQELIRMLRCQRCRMMEAREKGSGMIAEGRDITTVVCPDADVRILLLADQEARLRRRTLELYGDATDEHMEIVRAQVEGRDKADSAVSEFMVAAPGVETVDSTGLDIDGVCEAILAHVDADLARRDAQ